MRLIKTLTIIATIACLSPVFALAPFTITPASSTASVNYNSSTSVTWTVTNNTTADTEVTINPSYQTTGYAPNISLQSNTCTGLLSASASCTFETLIDGAQQPSSFQVTPQVCGFASRLCAAPISASSPKLQVTTTYFSHYTYAYLGSRTGGPFGSSALSAYTVETGVLSDGLVGFKFNNNGGITASTDGTNIYSANMVPINSIVGHPRINISAAPTGPGMAPTSVGGLTLSPTVSLSVNMYLAVTPDKSTVYFVTNNTAYVIDVTDPTAPSVTTSISGISSGRTIVMNPAGTKAYVAGGTNIYVIDTASNTLDTTYSTAENNAGLAISPDGSTLYSANEDNAGKVSFIEAATGNVTDTISVGDTPSGIAVTPDGSKLYVANSNDSTVSVISTASHTVTTTIGLSPLLGGYAVGISPDGSTGFVVMAQDVAVLNLTTNTVTSSFPLYYTNTAQRQYGNFVA